eukprot:scaffold3224_cov158-Amphora_coffeaeformis.AAC.22
MPKDGKYCFGPRDQARQKARRAIRQRVNNGALPDPLLVGDVEKKAWNSHDVVELLNRIISNDRSFFSLQNLEQRQGLLSHPIPIKFVWDDVNADMLRGQDKLRSWYGLDGTEQWKEYLSKLQSIVPLDFAFIFQRYQIVGSFLIGGINPCIRGRFHDESDIDKNWEEQTQTTGWKVLQRFFEDVRVPLTLFSYVLKRSFDLRFAYWKNLLEKHSCDLCNRTHVPRSRSFLFSSSKSCPHVICETCYWTSVLQRLDQSESDDDVVTCPCCHPLAGSMTLDPPPDLALRYRRKEECSAKFHKLPKFGGDLKQSGTSRKVKNGRFILSSSWSEAVKPFLGVTQETRSDRFLGFVETGSFRQVQSCLEFGVDLDLTNQYGQTALFTSAWRGHVSVVRVLLNHGADPLVVANGGATPADAASSKGFTEIVHLLQAYGGSLSASRDYCLSLTEQKLVAEEIISRSAQHPGAGSYTVDGILDEISNQCLVSIWKSLPVAEGKKKSGPCSERRYYCDTSRYVTSLLNTAVAAVSGGLEGVIFLPFMRFLCYHESGTILAPHVDLCREDFDSGKQSTHTFILYLSDCVEGGATILLGSVSGSGRDEKLAVVRPVRGRLLLFPHACPHEGEKVVDLPKLLIRGEAFLPDENLLKQ